MIKSALIINAYSARNAGDAAIMLSTADFLIDQGFQRIVVSSRYYEEDSDFYAQHGLSVIAPLINFPISHSRLNQIVSFGFSLVWWILMIPIFLLARPGKFRSLNRWSEFELIVSGGGGYLYSSKRRFNLTFIHSALQMVVASWAVGKKRALMMPQSIGPLNKNLDRFLCKIALRSMSAIVPRELSSQVTVAKLLPSADNVLLCPDVAFWGWSRLPSPVINKPIPRDIVIVVMDWTWAQPSSIETLKHYVRQIALLTSALSASGHSVGLAGHSRIAEQNQDDLEVARRVHALLDHSMRDSVLVMDFGDRGCDAIREQFIQTQLVIGTRLHSCIIALESGTPAIPLGYQPKSKGTYELLELGDWYFDASEFAPSAVVKLSTELLENVSSARSRVSDAILVAREQIRSVYERQMPQ